MSSAVLIVPVFICPFDRFKRWRPQSWFFALHGPGRAGGQVFVYARESGLRLPGGHFFHVIFEGSWAQRTRVQGRCWGLTKKGVSNLHSTGRFCGRSCKLSLMIRISWDLVIEDASKGENKARSTVIEVLPLGIDRNGLRADVELCWEKENWRYSSLSTE